MTFIESPSAGLHLTETPPHLITLQTGNQDDYSGTPLSSRIQGHGGALGIVRQHRTTSRQRSCRPNQLLDSDRSGLELASVGRVRQGSFWRLTGAPGGATSCAGAKEMKKWRGIC